MKRITHKLLEEAHITISNATGVDVPKYKLEEAYKKVRLIYRKIKELDPAIYEILDADDNHKTK